MARAKAPVYRAKGTPTCIDLIADLRKEVSPLANVDAGLYQRLTRTIDDLEMACRAVLPISKSGVRIGFGVDKTQRNIAVATAIEILRQIKAVKAW